LALPISKHPLAPFVNVTGFNTQPLWRSAPAVITDSYYPVGKRQRSKNNLPKLLANTTPSTKKQSQLVVNQHEGIYSWENDAWKSSSFIAALLQND